MRRLPPLLLALALAACARLPAESPREPLAYDPAQVARSETLAIFIPGVLSSVEMFAPARDWAGRGYGLAFYRFPGFDGLPLDHRLDLETAAETIARFAARHPDKPVVLVGYSTGAPIALMAAARLAPRPVTVAAISPAVEHGGGLDTLLKGARDMAGAAARASRSGAPTRKAIWLEYWKTLLYGRKNRLDPDFAARIDALFAANEERIGQPDPELVRAHTADLRGWTIPEGLDLSHARIGYFIGMEDPVFSPRQTDRLRRRLEGGERRGRIVGFADDGHLLLLTRASLFDHVLRFVEE